MDVTHESRFSLLPLEGGGAKRRRLAHALYWQNRINEFLQSVRFLNDHGIGLWCRSPCDHCIYSMGRGRESTCDFPLPGVFCLVPDVELSPLHITPFSPLSFFLKAPYRCHAGIGMVLFIVFHTRMIKNEEMIKWKLVDRMNIVHIILITNQKMMFAYMWFMKCSVRLDRFLLCPMSRIKSMVWHHRFIPRGGYEDED